MFNPFKTLNFDVETVGVYTQRKDPITLSMVGTGQTSRLNARSLPILFDNVRYIMLYNIYIIKVGNRFDKKTT